MKTNNEKTCPECGDVQCEGCGRHEDFAEKYIGDMGVGWFVGKFIVLPVWIILEAAYIFLKDIYRVANVVYKCVKFPFNFHRIYKREKKKASMSKAEQAEAELAFCEASTEERVAYARQDGSDVRVLSPDQVQKLDGDWVEIDVE